MIFEGRFINDKGKKIELWFSAPSEEVLRKHLAEKNWQWDDAKFSPDMRVCPHCKQENPMFKVNCHRCGSWLRTFAEKLTPAEMARGLSQPRTDLEGSVSKPRISNEITLFASNLIITAILAAALLAAKTSLEITVSVCFVVFAYNLKNNS